MNNLIEKQYNTPIGTVLCALSSDHKFVELDKTGTYKNGVYEIYTSISHHIEVIEFKLKMPLYNGESVADSMGWIWRIEKINDNPEKLQLKTSIIDFPENIEFDVASGENLDAIEISNDEWKMHIGTEDGQMLNYRAINNDGFPNRLSKDKNDWVDITELNKSSIMIDIPELKTSEKIYLQILMAYDRQNRDSVNTWLAVDQNKSSLEAWIGIN